MSQSLGARAEVFRELLTVWNDGDPQAVLCLVTDDYLGHMLYLAAGCTAPVGRLCRAPARRR